MLDFLRTVINSPSFWAIGVAWIVVCIAWVGRWRTLLYRIGKIVVKPIIFKHDPDSYDIPFYPRSLLEDIANGFRDTLRKPFIDLRNVITKLLSDFAVILPTRNFLPKFMGYVVLIIGWLIAGILYFVDYLLTIVGSLIPFAIDIAYRLVYILVDGLQWFITTPILVPFSMITRTFAMVKVDSNVGKNIVISGDNTVVSINNEQIKKETKNDKSELNMRKILDEIGKKYFKVSISHPKNLSKRFESPFVIQLYFEELTSVVKQRIKQVVGDDFGENIYDTELNFGQVVKIKLFSPDISFPESIVKKLDNSINSMVFLGKPSEVCTPGSYKVVLSILDNKSGIEFQSETFQVKVVDYAFDHVSSPLLSKVSATILGVGSFAMFMLTFLEQIDKTVGLTSGTAAGVLAAVIYTNFYNLYQRIHPTTS